MGVYPSVLWLSNFLMLFFVILVDALLITMVLCLCGLLPKSDPSLVLLLMINYGISIIMFTFLLSVIMKKATSGSVASFLLFILTFLPFLILISLRYAPYIRHDNKHNDHPARKCTLLSVSSATSPCPPPLASPSSTSPGNMLLMSVFY